MEIEETGIAQPAAPPSCPRCGGSRFRPTLEPREDRVPFFWTCLSCGELLGLLETETDRAGEDVHPVIPGNVGSPDDVPKGTPVADEE